MTDREFAKEAFEFIKAMVNTKDDDEPEVVEFESADDLVSKLFDGGDK